MEQLAACIDPAYVIPDPYLTAVGEVEYQQRVLDMISKQVAKPADLDKLLTQQMVDEFIDNK